MPPVFDFQCKKCKHACEQWIRKHDETVKCCECGSDMVKQAGASNLAGFDKLGRSK